MSKCFRKFGVLASYHGSILQLSGQNFVWQVLHGGQPHSLGGDLLARDSHACSTVRALRRSEDNLDVDPQSGPEAQQPVDREVFVVATD